MKKGKNKRRMSKQTRRENKAIRKELKKVKKEQEYMDYIRNGFTSFRISKRLK